MDLLLSLINITKTLSNVLAAVAVVLPAKGRMEGGRRKKCVWCASVCKKRVGGGQIAYLFFHSRRTIKISVLHACLTHTDRRPPPLHPLSLPAMVKSIFLSLSL